MLLHNQFRLTFSSPACCSLNVLSSNCSWPYILAHHQGGWWASRTSFIVVKLLCKYLLHRHAFFFYNGLKLNPDRLKLEIRRCTSTSILGWMKKNVVVCVKTKLSDLFLLLAQNTKKTKLVSKWVYCDQTHFKKSENLFRKIKNGVHSQLSPRCASSPGSWVQVWTHSKPLEVGNRWLFHRVLEPSLPRR